MLNFNIDSLFVDYFNIDSTAAIGITKMPVLWKKFVGIGGVGT